MVAQGALFTYAQHEGVHSTVLLEMMYKSLYILTLYRGKSVSPVILFHDLVSIKLFNLTLVHHDLLQLLTLLWKTQKLLSSSLWLPLLNQACL